MAGALGQRRWNTEDNAQTKKPMTRHQKESLVRFIHLWLFGFHPAEPSNLVYHLETLVPTKDAVRSQTSNGV